MGAEHEVELAQGTLRYRDTGPAEAEAATLVFLHGAFADGDLWRGVVPQLSGRWRCVTPDLPLGAHTLPMPAGADLTPPGLARLIADFLAALDLRDAVLVANDTAGALAQLVVTQHPERVGRLVLTSCDAFDHFPPPLFRPLVVLARRVPRLFGLALRLLRASYSRRWALRLAGVCREAIPADLVDAWTRPALDDPAVRRDLLALVRGVDARFTLAAAERLPAFDRPTLLAWGTADRLFPLALAHRLAALLPDARLERVEDAAAIVPLDQPERLAALLADFLATTDRGGADGEPLTPASPTPR
jgi:pimeloyl-ACP methyl ester carboxylesterase